MNLDKDLLRNYSQKELVALGTAINKCDYNIDDKRLAINSIVEECYNRASEVFDFLQETQPENANEIIQEIRDTGQQLLDLIGELLEPVQQAQDSGYQGA